MSEAAADLSGASALLYCVGAQKAGTTWLHQQLVRHDRVHAPVKEVHYWDTRRAPYMRWGGMGFPAAKIEKGVALSAAETMLAAPPDDHSSYHAFLARGAAPGDVVLDFTPAYALCAASTFAEMRAAPVRTLFVLMLRDPVSRMWAGVRQRYRRMFEAGRAQERHLVDAFTRSLDDPYDHDYRRSRYDTTLGELRKSIPATDLLILSFPQLFADGVSRVLRFVGLSGSVEQSDSAANVGVAGGAELRTDLVVRAYERLKPAYEAADATFGGRPEGWLTGDRLTYAGPRLTI